MNPYALFLGKRDAIEVIAGTSQRLEDLAAALGPDGLERSPGPGQWSAREILCPLADCEVGFGFPIRPSLGEERHVIQPFDQDKWAGKYAPYDAHAALAVFSTVRKWNRTLIAN